MTVTENPYLTGNFGPVSVETTAVDLPVTGTIPVHLDGRYLRNGPNPLGPVDPARHHWFLGTGMVHGVRLRDGRAEWYRNRFVRSADVARTLGEEPRPGAPVHAGFDFPANTSVIVQGGRTYAIVDVPTSSARRRSVRPAGPSVAIRRAAVSRSAVRTAGSATLGLTVVIFP